METRANYVLIGVFTVLGILAGLGFFVWLAKVQVDRQYAYYDVLFDSVSGLGRASDVRFNGLPVGQVVTLGLYDRDPGKVRVRIEVAAETPINEETTAQLQSQGVTGVSFVALTSGRPDAPPLTAPEGRDVPIIIAQRSLVEQLTQDAPDFVTQTMDLMRSLQTLLSPGNVANVTSTIANVERATQQLEATLRDVSSISATVAEAAGEIGGFTEQLAPVGAALESALASAEETLAVARKTFAEADTTLASATGALDNASSSFEGADALIRTDLPRVIAELEGTVTSLRTAIDGIGAEATATLAGFGTTADLANARLTELETTLVGVGRALEETTSTMAAVDSASVSFEELMDGEGAALVADARAAFSSAETSIAAIDAVLTDDVPAIVSDVRTAVATAAGVIETVGADISTFAADLAPLSGTADETLQAATATFRDAGRTLAALDQAMDTAERTLVAAEATFTGANRIIDEEVAPTAADIRSAAAAMSDALAQVSQDLPAVTGDLRTAIARATDVVARVDAVVAASAPPVQNFAQSGLPQFVRFTEEARALVAQLERVAARLERDPARFFLGNQAPEYRR